MQIIDRLDPDRVKRVIEHITTHLLPLATAERAKCAKGRLNLWLQAEPNYQSKKYINAHNDPKLWQFCQRIWSNADLAQVYWASNNIGINWHRDAAYAKADARIINLGEVCLQTKLKDGNLVSLELTGGEVVQFNSKLIHRAIPRRDDRIGIGLWSAAIPLTDKANWQ